MVTKTGISSSWVYVNGKRMFVDAGCLIWETIDNFEGDENNHSFQLGNPLPYKKTNIITYDKEGKDPAYIEPVRNRYNSLKGMHVGCIRIS